MRPVQISKEADKKLRTHMMRSQIFCNSFSDEVKKLEILSENVSRIALVWKPVDNLFPITSVEQLSQLVATNYY